MTNEELQEILRKHKLYLEGQSDGVRANLRGANLESANLESANLRGANLESANLESANLRGANLRSANLGDANLGDANLESANLRSANLGDANLGDANLESANLYGANLGDANLYGANLRSANLGDANLRSANLESANLESANLIRFQIPQEGELIVWKKLHNGVVAKLRVPPNAKRTACLINRKCRAEFVEVLALFPESSTEAIDRHSQKVVYKVGEKVYPDSYDPNIAVDCTNGIHFFLTREEAEEW